METPSISTKRDYTKKGPMTRANIYLFRRSVGQRLRGSALISVSLVSMSLAGLKKSEGKRGGGWGWLRGKKISQKVLAPIRKISRKCVSKGQPEGEKKKKRKGGNTRESSAHGETNRRKYEKKEGPRSKEGCS